MQERRKEEQVKQGWKGVGIGVGRQAGKLKRREEKGSSRGEGTREENEERGEGKENRRERRRRGCERVIDVFAVLSIITTSGVLGITTHGLYFYFPDMSMVSSAPRPCDAPDARQADCMWATLVVEHLLFLGKLFLESVIPTEVSEEEGDWGVRREDGDDRERRGDGRDGWGGEELTGPCSLRRREPITSSSRRRK
eukprot:750996-Hanusia_phi.AAC.5